MNSLEKKNLALEKELISAKTDCNNTLQKLKEAEKRCSELQTSVQRFVLAAPFLTSPLGFCLTSIFIFSFELFSFSLEEKLSHVENENHVLRQKTLSTPQERIGHLIGEVCNLRLFSAVPFEICMCESTALFKFARYLAFFTPCVLPPLLVT